MTFEDTSWVKLHDAARQLGVSEVTLRRKIKGGKIPYEFREGRYYVYLGDAPWTEPPADKAPRRQSPGALPLVAPSPKGDTEEVIRLRAYVRKLQRTLEDQQTLIDALESALQGAARRSHSRPS